MAIVEPRAIRTPAKIGLLVALAIGVSFARRPDQFLAPYIWAEEGVIVLRQYAEQGLSSVLEPIAGYQALAARLVTLGAFKVSLLWAPEIAAVLAVAFTSAIVLTVALAPTHLPWPFACAVAALLVPMAPETFAVSLFVFWWAGLLLVLALLWDTGRGLGWLRIAFIIFGGLSSPLIVPFAALFVLRAVVERDRQEFLATGASIVIAAVQLATMRQTGAFAAGIPLTLSVIPVAINKFAGPFVMGPRNWLSAQGPGFYTLAILAVPAFYAAIRRRLDWRILLLALAWCAVCASAAARLDISGLDPRSSGPRYYFYPFILLSWIAIWIAARSPRVVGAVFAFGFALALAYVGPKLSSRHDPIDWREQIRLCLGKETHDVPLHTNGTRAGVWHVALTGTQCRTMIDASLFGR